MKIVYKSILRIYQLHFHTVINALKSLSDAVNRKYFNGPLPYIIAD